MYNAMMDPELMRLAQEQMSRIPPQELARMQQEIMANPDLVRLATESMKDLRPEDLRRAAEQLKQTRTEDMVEVSEKIAKATPEELASIKAHSDAQMSYEINAAKMLKQQGNELHSRGQYHDAAKKYLHAKSNLQRIPSSLGGTIQLQCSLNLMSCYLKMEHFEDCIKEGSEVLAYDSRNVKAFYRRGQAYKEIGNLEAAVSDLNKAHQISPDDETIVDVLRDAKEKLIKEGGNVNHGLVIEEIIEDSQTTALESQKSSSVQYSVVPPVEGGECSQKLNQSFSDVSIDEDRIKKFREDPEANRSFQNYVSNADPSTLEAMGLRGISPDMVKTAGDMISNMKPEELQKMFQIASSLNPKEPDNARTGSKFPEMSPEMFKMASDTLSKMPPEELEKMLKIASSLNANGASPVAKTNSSNLTSTHGFKSPSDSIRLSTEQLDVGESNFADSLLNSRMGQSSSSIPTSTADLQEQMQNSMKDPAMRQMFTSMMKNMSPEMMANMSEQFGMKLSKEDAEKAQQAMSQLSPDDLDRMLRWADKAQRAAETAKKTKNWLLGRPGMILAIVMLILAFVLRQLGFIGG